MGRGIKLPRPKKLPQIVEVTWHDAAMQDGANVGMAVMKSAGYYVFKGIDPDSGRKVIKIATDLDGGEPRTYHVIPQVHVIGFTLMAVLEAVVG